MTNVSPFLENKAAFCSRILADLGQACARVWHYGLLLVRRLLALPDRQDTGGGVMKKKRQISLKLKQSTIKDILSLGEKKGHKCFSETLRYLIHVGFSNLGNWRKDLGEEKW